MTKNKQVSALLIAALLATGVASTATAKNEDMRAEHRAQAFERMDANNDGSVSSEEFMAAGDRFARADADGNGLLTAEELAAAGQAQAQQRIARMIERLDANDDGALSKDEIEARNDRDPSRMFDRLDADDDGVLSADEFAEARMGRGGDRGHGGGKGHGGGMRHGDR
jgi:Ca2+-binding EF-hand superfamily protein